MFYVYTLRSLVNGDLYIGVTDDLKQRYKDHNGRRVKSTKGYVPWELVYYEAYKAKRDATRRERQLKMQRAKGDLIKQIQYSIGAVAKR